MSNTEWLIANQFRLGLPQSIIPPRLSCVCNGSPTVDPDGFHFFSCKSGGEIHNTHNSIARVLFSLVRSTGLQGKLEPFVDKTQSLNRVDLIIYNPGLNNKKITEITDDKIDSNIIVDVRISFPCAESYVAQSAMKQGFTALHAF